MPAPAYLSLVDTDAAAAGPAQPWPGGSRMPWRYAFPVLVVLCALSWAATLYVWSLL